MWLFLVASRFIAFKIQSINGNMWKWHETQNNLWLFKIFISDYWTHQNHKQNKSTVEPPKSSNISDFQGYADMMLAFQNEPMFFALLVEKALKLAALQTIVQCRQCSIFSPLTGKFSQLKYDRFIMTGILYGLNGNALWSCITVIKHI